MVEMTKKKNVEREPLVRVTRAKKNKESKRWYYYMIAFVVFLGILFLITKKQAVTPSGAPSSSTSDNKHSVMDNPVNTYRTEEDDDITQDQVEDTKPAPSQNDNEDDGDGVGESEVGEDDKTKDSASNGADDDDHTSEGDDNKEIENDNVESESDIVGIAEADTNESHNAEEDDDGTEDTADTPTPSDYPGPAEDWAWVEQHEIIPPMPITDFTAPALLENFYKARETMYEQLKHDYGPQAFEAMFLRDNGQVSVGRTAFSSPRQLARDRIKRKLVIKLLQGQLASANNDKGASMVPFIWASGGHSAAAAHGDYYNQSYTAQLERIGRNVFASAGMHLIGRNYAMGGTASGMEVGSCVDQVFGMDIDVLSWDFGMTDGKGAGLFENYFSHAAIHPNRPFMVAVNFDGYGRMEIIDHMEESGLPIIHMVQSEFNEIFARIPDTLGLSQEEIDRMPPMLRYFKCDNQVESGEPGCGDNKFSNDHCTDRKFRVSWHPGWKWHGLYGNIMALTLTDILEDALKFLVEKETYNTEELLRELIDDEGQDYDKFFASNLTDFGNNGIVPKEEQDKLDMRMVLRKRPFCRICRLPAQARYLGLMTETPPGGMLHYEKGISLMEARQNPNVGGQMRLIFEEKDRQQCEIPLNQDYKDYYIVTGKDDWQYITIPNDREAQHYGDGEPLQGLIMLTMPGCDWGQCPDDDIRASGYEEGTIEMEINGIKVTSATLASGSHFVRHGDKELFFPSNNEGRFEIRVKLNAKETSFTRFSAFTIW